MKVKLDDVIIALESVNMETQCFYDKETGKIEYVFDFDTDGLTGEDIDASWERYIALPSDDDINEYSMMEKFIELIDDEGISNKLENAIHGRGAFRYFKDTLYQFGIENEWYEYRNEKYKEIALEWCKENGIDDIR